MRDYPLEVRHRDGHTVPVLYNATVYRDEAGEVIGVFAAARDITEIKKAEAALQELNATLEQRVVGTATCRSPTRSWPASTAWRSAASRAIWSTEEAGE